jgi:hypothetical protein
VTAEPTAPVSEQVRAACAWVASRARFVRIDEGAIEGYAARLPAPEAAEPDPATALLEGDRETRAAFAICLNAINFGSGWWPTIRKRPGHSGYFTVAAGVTERFREHGAWPASELAGLSAVDIATVLGQDPEHPLMAQFAGSLRDVGTRLLSEHDASFSAAVDAAEGSALALAGLLAGWDAFADVSIYEERPVPFFKRAQLAAADIDRAGVATLPDRDRLTAFADNLVPHVLRVDGLLQLDPALSEAIEAGRLLDHGSTKEVELRACAVQAVELLAAATGSRLTPPDVDAALWNRGRGARYKGVPRPRSRNTAY